MCQVEPPAGGPEGLLKDLMPLRLMGDVLPRELIWLARAREDKSLDLGRLVSTLTRSGYFGPKPGSKARHEPDTGLFFGRE